MVDTTSSAETATGPGPEPADRPRRIIILGATGSIGTSTLAVIGERPADFAVEAVTAFGNAESLARVARAAGARLAVIADRSAYDALRNALAGTGIEAAAGIAAVEEAAARPVDIVVAGIVGSAGLAPTLAAIKAGSSVALANKECLVCAGDLFMSEARRVGVEILPVDSEHNAIFQALDRQAIDLVERIILTASGGPFREWTKEAMVNASPAEAIKHPNWSMGPKISVDSATLMNKGLELIEAHHLFGIESDRIDVLIHPQSVVHGIVAYRDGSMIAQMGVPDMRTPIAHCLSWPRRSKVAGPALDLAKLGRLNFARPDLERFPALKLARQALAAGGWATNVLNAANEVAVAAFLAGNLGFLEIARIVEETMERAEAQGLDRSPATIKDALALDREGRRIAGTLLVRQENGRPLR
ncbi:MAG: 1-deoxy-D-xylulose-5-phosphate reductoisomerase [Bauldia sp.]|nr:MAG: 1-deoxy-D-xylulose-5-phosphate reductoisomerase [Bauldia sp.]MBZ0228101.1 1-deoxy-D-xylulose-5-phosphate reductoisomerase [Bauldia sp.]